MSTRISVFLQVFSGICCVTLSIAATIHELQFNERAHRGFVNNVLNVCPQEGIKWGNIG
jgi:hypothetical protein